MKSTDEMLSKFKNFHEMIEVKFDRKMEVLHSNNGREYISKDFQLYLSDNKIKSQT